MAAQGEGTAAFKSVPFEDKGQKKTSMVSFGFTKTVNKFKAPSAEESKKKEERDYLTGIHGKELQR